MRILVPLAVLSLLVYQAAAKKDIHLMGHLYIFCYPKDNHCHFRVYSELKSKVKKSEHANGGRSYFPIATLSPGSPPYI